MMNRIIGLVGMAAAVFMWVMAGATVFRMVGVWPDEVVLHLFMTALCTLSGVALWSFGTVYLGRAREAKEARRRERLGLGPVVSGADAAADGSESGAEGLAGGARGHAAQGGETPSTQLHAEAGAAAALAPEAGSATVAGSTPKDGAAAGSAREAAAPAPDAAAAPEAGEGGFNEGVAAVDLRDISLENIAPEHFALAFESSAEQESAGVDEPAAEHGKAQVMLRALPEVREALAETGRARVKLVRKVVGAGQDPLLVVLLGWTPIAKVKPGTAEYRALIGFAGKEGEVSAEPAAAVAAGDDDAIQARLDMRS